MQWASTLLLLFVPLGVDLRDVEALLTRGEYGRALGQLSQVTNKSARWHLLASRAYDGLDDPAKAVTEAEEALRLEPDQPAHHLQLAQIFLSRNTPKAAFEILTDASARFPEAFVIRLGRGLAAKELQLYEEAERELTWCLTRQPGAAIAVDALGTILIQLSRFADARSVATQFVKFNSADYRGYYFLAAAADGGEAPVQEVLSWLDESLHRNPNFAAAHALMGKVLLRDGKPRKAIAALERATALRPNLVSAHLHLARAYRELGDEQSAAREFRIVRELKANEQQAVPTLLYHRGTSP